MSKTKEKQIEFSCPMSREEAEKIYHLGHEAVVFVLMELAKRVAAQKAASESTPSGMKPPYEKGGSAEDKEDKEKKPGAKKGHEGNHRRKPAEPDREEEHEPQDRCPDCGSALEEECERRFRIIEDIEETESEATRHSVPRQWCPNCQKFVEPPVPDALPGATLGHRVVILTAWLHLRPGPYPFADSGGLEFPLPL